MDYNAKGLTIVGRGRRWSGIDRGCRAANCRAVFLPLIVNWRCSGCHDLECSYLPSDDRLTSRLSRDGRSCGGPRGENLNGANYRNIPIRTVRKPDNELTIGYGNLSGFHQCVISPGLGKNVQGAEEGRPLDLYIKDPFPRTGIVSLCKIKVYLVLSAY